MGSRQLDTEDLQAIRKLAKEWGKIVARRAFGDEGPAVDVNFAAMEEIAWAAAQGVNEGTLEQMLAQQAKHYGEEQKCPECGQLWPVEREPRTLVVRGGGEVEHDEPKSYCRRCRRDFFPSAGAVGVGSPGLQSRGAGENRPGGSNFEVVCRSVQGPGSAGGNQDQ